MESQALAKEEQDQRTKDSLKAKKAELDAKEEMKRAEKEANAETMKKTKIERETVDDELQCDFEVTFDVDDDDEGPDHETSEPNKRRYRRKGDAEEGEIDDHEGSKSPSRSRSRSRSKSRSYSRSVSRSRSRSETTLSDSEDEANIERLRQKRKERLRDIKEQKRVTKSASEVDDGEVDSEGEDFKIIEETAEKSEVKVDNEEVTEPIQLIELNEPIIPSEHLEHKEPNEAKDESNTKHEEESAEVFSEQIEQMEVPETKLESVEPEDIDNEPMEVQDYESILESDSQDLQSSSAMTSSQPSPLVNETDSQDSSVNKVPSKKRRKVWTRQVPNQEPDEPVQEEEPDYVFKTKRQLLHEREHAPEEPVQVEDNEEELERQREAEKIKEKRQKQMEMRLKRMQAFQERSEIKEDEQEGDFYKSYYDAEEERLRIEQEAVQAAEEEAAAQAAQEVQEQPDKPQYIEITKDEPTKDPEVAEKEGVAYWTKMIDDDDDVEVPQPGSPKKTKINRDLPSKAQVDAHQAEQETWADRWYQNKKVQKVVQDSKIYSKVKANIKTKFVKPIEAIEESLRPGTSAKDLKAEAIRRKLNKNPQNTALPVIGSLDEYSKIKADNEPLETKSDSSDDDSSDEGDGLWSAIMGKD